VDVYDGPTRRTLTLGLWGNPLPPDTHAEYERLLARLRRRHPGQWVEVWAEDEARLGSKPIARRIWSRRGRRPRSNGRARYYRLYVYALTARR
jgi:hypothetical protein